MSAMLDNASSKSTGASGPVRSLRIAIVLGADFPAEGIPPAG